MDKQAIAQQALQNATTHTPTMNYNDIFNGFAEKGIAFDDILPRENVFTFHAWKALNRQVRKGEHGVKVCTWVPMMKKGVNADGQETQEGFRAPRTTTVFHISQTEPIGEAKPLPKAEYRKYGADEANFTELGRA